MPPEFTPRQKGERAIALARAGIIGERTTPPARDRETMALVFDAMTRSIDHRRAPSSPVTIQWDFTDAEPWRIEISNGSTNAAPARVSHPDLTFRCRWEDWVDVAMGRQDARAAFLRQRLRPRGNLRLLVRSASLFGV
jgi:putative sterol carrier protein